MTQKVKPRNGGTMTEAQYFAKLRSALRNAFRWWVPMKTALKAAERKSQSTNKRIKFEYQCASCSYWYPRKEVEIDHIIPCGTLKSYDDIAIFVQNMTPENTSAFQVLCKSCHKLKTNLENLKNRKNGA